VAYFLGSMAVFVPFLSDFLGQGNDGKHMVATVTVYFHPGRTQGSMFEAVFFALMAFLYAAIISFTSMGVSTIFGQTLELYTIGHMVVLVVFCGGGLGFVGWIKQRLGNPLVNVACSLTSLAIITVLTKETSVLASEFSASKVMQVMKMVLMGIISSTTVCFVVFPLSARKLLRQNMLDVTNSFGEMVALITQAFLAGSAEELEQSGFNAISDRHKAGFITATKNLRESKFEHYVFGTETDYHLEAKLIDCMRRMAQSIGGLRSAAATQFALLAQNPGGGVTPMAQSIYTPTTAGVDLSPVDTWMSTQESYVAVNSIDETSKDEDESSYPQLSRVGSLMEGQNSVSTIRSTGEIFERFTTYLGPSMVKFVTYLTPGTANFCCSDLLRTP
jgi:hypothetical protein